MVSKNSASLIYDYSQLFHRVDGGIGTYDLSKKIISLVKSNREEFVNFLSFFKRISDMGEI